MKKWIFLFTFFTSFLLGSCNEDTYDYEMYVPNIDDIDSIYFSTGSLKLIADGQASLDFIVEAFRKVKMTNEEGVRVDSLVEINLESLPQGSIKIFKGTEEVGTSWSTEDATPGTVTFTAKIGDKVSKPKTVTLRPKPEPFPLKYVDVIFHVFELKPSDPSYNKLSYQEIEYEFLEEAVQNMNDVFNNKLGRGPNGAAANITFRLATKNANGVELLKPGYNRIDYDENNLKKGNGGFDVNSFINYMNENASRIWDPDRYLNIVIIQSGANMSMSTVRPQWQVVPDGNDAIPGISEIVSDYSIPTRNYANTCVGVPATLFRPGGGKKIELYPFVGSFYGLVSTNLDGDDYCSDTQQYSTNQWGDGLKKTGYDGEKFLANNAMDNNRDASLRNNFTLDQVTRIRQVMEYCPGRRNGLDQ